MTETISPVLAYLDPGLGSLVIQVVIGTIFGAGLFFRQSIGTAMAWAARPFKRAKAE